MARRFLVINAGSSSLKWSVLDWPREEPAMGGDVPLRLRAPPELDEPLARAGEVAAVAHRVVHGGARFRSTTRIDAAVRAALEELTEIDPLHAPRTLMGIDAAMRARPDVPHFACFDTAFHADLPAAAATYAIPRAWTERWGLRRFGFHGLSVAHAARRVSALMGRVPRSTVVCHLGSGCSVTALGDRGTSRDTTMGFTPLEGVMMATRSGSVDPGMLLHLLRARRVTVEELDDALEHRSGLLGVSGVSGDFRQIVEAADAGHEGAMLAHAMFVESVVGAIGRMMGVLAGCEALVFTGGLGEHSARLRASVLARFHFAGARVDEGANQRAAGDAEISPAGSAMRIFVIAAREDLTMAREVAAALGG